MNKKHNNVIDDYLRLVTSISGKYLGSISMKKQLTIFNLQLNKPFTNWSQQNITYISFSQSQSQFIVITKTPSIKLYQIKSSNSNNTNNQNQNQKQKQKYITLIKQLKPQQSSTTYGWIVWSLDNKYIYYVKTDDLYAMNIQTYQQSQLTKDNYIKNNCIPSYLLIDRNNKQLLSSSKNGIICKYNLQYITLNQNNSNNSTNSNNYTNSTINSTTTNITKPQVTLIQSTKLSSSSALTIADMNQGNDFLIISTTVITQNKINYYCSYIISKLNINMYWKIKLTQQLSAPPLMIQSDNIQNYILAFLKGQKSLYIFNVQSLQPIMTNYIDVINTTKDESQSDDIKILIPKQIISMPYLMHSINYNLYKKQLLLGISGQNNQDKILSMNFKFNCSKIINLNNKQSTINNNESTINNNESTINNNQQIINNNESIYNNAKQQQIKQLCTQQCQTINTNYYFSFLQGRCINKTQYVINSQILCRNKSNNYIWNNISQQCELNCQNTINSLSHVSYGTPQQCYCDQNYVWSTSVSSCQSIYGNKSMITNSSSIPILKNETDSSSNKNITNSTNNQNVIKNKTDQKTNNVNIIPIIPIDITPVKPQTSNSSNQSVNNNNGNQSVNNNSGNKSGYNQQIVPSNVNNDASSDHSVAIVLSILSVLLIIGVIVIIYLYKKKILCFKSQSYVQDNELKQSDIRSNQQFQKKDNNHQQYNNNQQFYNSQKNNNSSKYNNSQKKNNIQNDNRHNNSKLSNKYRNKQVINNKQLYKNKQIIKHKQQSPMKLFDINDNNIIGNNLNNKGNDIDLQGFIIQSQIITQSNDNHHNHNQQFDHQTDSQRKL